MRLAASGGKHSGTGEMGQRDESFPGIDICPGNIARWFDVKGLNGSAVKVDQGIGSHAEGREFDRFLAEHLTIGIKDLIDARLSQGRLPGIAVFAQAVFGAPIHLITGEQHTAKKEQQNPRHV